MTEPRRSAPLDPDTVAQTLSATLTAAPDDFDHPGHEHLTALVDGQLDEADREWVEDHVEHCRICKQDVADLADVATLIPKRRSWMTPVMAWGAAAAGIGMVLWLGWPTPKQETAVPAEASTAATATSPSPPAAPAAPSTPAILTPDESNDVALALESGRMEFPRHAALLRGHAGTLLGTAEAETPAGLTTPVGTSVIDARPLFSWTPVDGATAYSVAVFDERFREVASSGRLDTTSWTPRRNLPRNRILAWQVTAHRPGGEVVRPAPPQPEARFFVLSVAAVSAAEAARTRLATEPVALGLALTKVGLFDDAQRAFEGALTDARYEPAQVRALLTRLRAR